MRFLFFIAFIFTSTLGFSQGQVTAVDTLAMNQDSVNAELLNEAGSQLERYQKQNTVGYLMTIAGSLLTMVALQNSNNDNAGTIPNGSTASRSKDQAFVWVGVAISGIGAVLTVSSSSHIGRAGRKLQKVRRSRITTR